MITIQKPAKQCEQDTVDLTLEETSCEVCGGSDREDRLLLCDGCDAGYHMECLTPPLNAVPVEEWFCPECEANNRQSRGSAVETSDTDSLPSTARTASTRSRTQTVQTRAIARTQHSERVRANVNRHRITQARTQELAPTYLIRSTWLDETINAVVAGLNSAVYVRDLTSQPSTRRRKSRKGRKTSSKSKMGKAGVKRRRRRVRRTKSRKKLVTKKTRTPRTRIANSLGIVKDKKSSSLPTVYRPSESTLSSMRADIGAASLSIYGDPFDLDPFTDREDDEQQAHNSLLLEAKRRGISRSACRSHQPVARPVSLSRRPVSIPQASTVAEAAPVPDLLGSILSGQSMLLMDSSDVIINRDGSLKTTKPMSFTNRMPDSRSRSSSSGDGPHVSPGPLLDHMDSLGSSDGSLDRHFSNNSSPLSPPLGSTFTPSDMSHTVVAPRGNPSLLGLFSHDPNRPNQRVGRQLTNGVSESRQNSPPSTHLSSESYKSKASTQSLKASTKPMWMDVSVLPRIPKIKKESSSDAAATKTGSNANKSNGSSSGSSSAHSHGLPDTAINRLAGDNEREHSVEQQHGRTAGPRNRPDGAGSSSGFSSSFSSSSSAASHTNHQRFSSGSSSSSSVSFRINSSGNSWHSRRLNIASQTPSGSSLQEDFSEEEKKRQLHRDKQKLLAARSKDSNSIYDPFNPTESDSGSSDGESGSINEECSSRLKQEPVKLKNKVFSKSRWDLKQVKVETQSSHSQDKPVTTTTQETLTHQQKGTKVNTPFRKSRFSHIERPCPFNTVIKKEPESDSDEVMHALDSDTDTDTQTVQSLGLIKTELTVKEEPTPDTQPAAPYDGNTLATSTASPIRESTSSPVRKSTSSSTKKSTSSPAKKSSSSPVTKSTSSPVRKSSSSPTRKVASSTSRKSASSPNRKSASSPSRKSASSPSRKSASVRAEIGLKSEQKIGLKSEQKIGLKSEQKIGLKSEQKIGLSPSRKSASSPSRKSASSPSRKSASSPSRKSASSPSRKSASSPSRKSASSPSRKSASSPTRKSASSPTRKSASSPNRKSASSPSRKSASSPSRKSASSPTRKSASSPSRKSASSPTRKSASSPTENWPQVPAENWPQVPAENWPQVPAENWPQVPAENWPQVLAENRPQVLAENRPQVLAENRPQVLAENRPQVLAENRPQVLAENRPQVPAENRPQVPAENRPQVPAENRPQVPAENRPQVPAENRPQVQQKIGLKSD
uniref:PHD-type domain-containing protein n=1 Tax=Neogobius melanostomus TaxID=47308 RepID=A0A8C6T6T7_9GOBI